MNERRRPNLRANAVQAQPKMARPYVFRSPAADARDGLPGCVIAQYTRCGKVGCRCAVGRPHGPYFYHYYRDAYGRARKRYLARQDAPRVAALCDRYRAGRPSRRQLRRLMRDYARLADRLDRWLGGEAP